MGDLVLPLDKGINTREAPNSLPPGWLWVCRGWYYEPDDPARLWKMPGRSLWAETSPATEAVLGMEYLQYDYQVDSSSETVRDRLVLWDEDGQLWETPGDYESGAAVKTMTKASMAGSYLTFPGRAPKAVHDGFNKWIMFSGGRGESRPIVRTVDGVYRPLGLTIPASAPTLEAETTGGSGSSGADDFYSRPTSGEVDTEVGHTADGLWTGFANAYDITGGHDYDPDLSTYAIARCRGAAMTEACRWSIAKWTGFATETPDQVDGYTLKISLENNFAGAPAGPAGVNVWISYDAGANWTLRAQFSSPSSITNLQLPLVGTSSFADLQVKISVYNNDYLNYNELKVFDIVAWKAAVTADPPDTDEALTGTYYYAVTEVYTHTDPWGGIFEIESSASPVASITIDSPGTGYKWIKVTMPPLVNATTYGDYGTGEVTRRLYRSTATGSYPDLGFLANVGATDGLVFYDTFRKPESLPPAELGTPSIPTIEVGSSVYFPRNDPPPTLLDAVLHHGSLVGIDGTNMADLVWSIPGETEYFPSIQRLNILGSERNDMLRGLGETGYYLLAFSAQKVHRIKGLQFATLQTFDLAQIETSTLTHTDGLAGTSRSICYFKSPDGLNLIAWVSERGIMASDGFLPAERGLGVINLTQNLDWDVMVDRASLISSKLTYDPIKQIVWFDYNVPAGVDGVRHRACLAIHVSAKHWMDIQGGYKVPKITGPHSQAVSARAIGEGRKMSSAVWDMTRVWAATSIPAPDGSGETLGEFPTRHDPIKSTPSASDAGLTHWTVKYDGHVYLEYDTFEDDADWTNAGGDIDSYAETGWVYPMPAWIIYQGELGHTNWGQAQTCSIIAQTRRDDTGSVQHTEKKGVSLLGARFTKFWLSRSGQSLRLALRHVGKAGGAVGPFKFDIEAQTNP